MKIKKFKVDLRKREIIKNFKILYPELKEITEELNQLIEKEIKNSSNYIFPSCIFDTFNEGQIKEKFNFKIEETLDFGDFKLSDNKNIISMTFFLLSIGDRIDEEIRNLDNSGEKIHSYIVKSIGLEACQVGINFIYRIINTEAEKENYSILPAQKITNTDLLKKIIDVLSGNKIGISLDTNNNLIPCFCYAGFFKWYTKIKKRT